MSKAKRLTEVFQAAKRISFNNDDRLVIFSDLHRGNNSWTDEFARNQIIYSYALQHYYDAGSTYVEVGDGDEVLFDDFSVHEGLVFEHQESELKIFVVHGHQGKLFTDTLFWLSRILLRSLWRPLQLLGIQDPTSVSQNAFQRKKIEKQLINWVQSNHQPMICGHTQRQTDTKADNHLSKSG